MPANYSKKRRIGSLKTDGSAQWTKFTQVGDVFYWSAMVQDVSTGSLTASQLTLGLPSIPTGINVIALITVNAFTSSSSSTVRVYSLLQGDAAVAYSTNANLYDVSAGVGATSDMEIMSNTSAQIAARSLAGITSFRVNVRGWIDRRGKDT
jgi:hypothetical protein